MSAYSRIWSNHHRRCFLEIYLQNSKTVAIVHYALQAVQRVLPASPMDMQFSFSRMGLQGNPPI
jgi:hypothetical protein